MVAYTNWAFTSSTATLYFPRILEEVQSLATGLQMTRLTKMCSIEAYIERNIAAKSALVINVFVPVVLHTASYLTKTEFVR